MYPSIAIAKLRLTVGKNRDGHRAPLVILTPRQHGARSALNLSLRPGEMPDHDMVSAIDRVLQQGENVVIYCTKLGDAVLVFARLAQMAGLLAADGSIIQAEAA